jgi:hypothetical protein
MKAKLKYPPVVLTGAQALSVAHGFARIAAQSGYKIHALSILPAHGHAIPREPPARGTVRTVTERVGARSDVRAPDVVYKMLSLRALRQFKNQKTSVFSFDSGGLSPYTALTTG